jgi:hypothetical protein
MFDYDEEFYHEPSEFDEKVEEFKETLMDSVKVEFKEEMDRLRKENDELQETKKKMKEIERDYENKKRDLQYERQNLETKIRKEKLSSLMKDFEVQLYTVGSKHYKKPKCDKCDENRRIHYTTPLGNKTYESCDCSGTIGVYEVIPTTLVEFSIRSGKSYVWYQVKESSRTEYLSYHDDTVSGKDLITSEEQFENASTWRPLLKTEELAQKFCDYLNKGKKD